MRLIVADTSPLVYLVLIDHIDILPRLFEAVLIPEAVHTELCNPLAPVPIPAWASAPPSWLEVKQVPSVPEDVALRPLDAGERSAIILALSMHADLVLIDERKGTQAALKKGLDVTGTLGILQRAARRDLLNLADAFDRLKRTNFRYRQEIMDKFLNEISGQA
jgi:predicted nucleic acid-binding protein